MSLSNIEHVKAVHKCSIILILIGDFMIEFNPKKIEKTVITLRIPVNTLLDIDKLSADIDLSRNEFIMQCIDFAIENYNESRKPNNTG